MKNLKNVTYGLIYQKQQQWEVALLPHSGSKGRFEVHSTSCLTIEDAKQWITHIGASNAKVRILIVTEERAQEFIFSTKTNKIWWRCLQYLQSIHLARGIFCYRKNLNNIDYVGIHKNNYACLASLAQTLKRCNISYAIICSAYAQHLWLLQYASVHKSIGIFLTKKDVRIAFYNKKHILFALKINRGVQQDEMDYILMGLEHFRKYCTQNQHHITLETPVYWYKTDSFLETHYGQDDYESRAQSLYAVKEQNMAHHYDNQTQGPKLHHHMIRQYMVPYIPFAKELININAQNAQDFFQNAIYKERYNLMTQWGVTFISAIVGLSLQFHSYIFDNLKPLTLVAQSAPYILKELNQTLPDDIFIQNLVVYSHYVRIECQYVQTQHLNQSFEEKAMQHAIQQWAQRWNLTRPLSLKSLQMRKNQRFILSFYLT